MGGILGLTRDLSLYCWIWSILPVATWWCGAPTGAVEARREEDVLPILEAYIKGQRICKVYVDGGAQVCVMSEKMMHRLGLEVQGKSEFKMANNVSIKCVGVCRGVKITVCGIKVAADMYVIPAQGEGYPVILGRPWLIAMNAR